MTEQTDGLPKSNEILRLFGHDHALIGMLHLLPLPGAPRFDPHVGMSAVLERAEREAGQLLDAGFDGFIVENGWDIPFVKPADVGHETSAALATVVTNLRNVYPSVPIGVNCLANAVDTSIAVACAAGGNFVRANQWANAYIANEGFIEGRAGMVARYRHSIGADDITVWADVHVKLGSHAITADRSLTEQARDAAWFDANALIVTGRRLGDPPLREELHEIKDATNLPVVVGSGVTVSNLAEIFEFADAAIVGSSIKQHGVWHGDMDEGVLKAMVHERNRVVSDWAELQESDPFSVTEMAE
ncbi:MAG: BtpA/SgcQ family protein [Microbacteriaceae bacterium]|nr:MAG: BtpA/SgcQ family protein [Microbacteriaceae bacterium]